MRILKKNKKISQYLMKKRFNSVYCPFNSTEVKHEPFRKDISSTYHTQTTDNIKNNGMV